jgi:MFS family permease
MVETIISKGTQQRIVGSLFTTQSLFSAAVIVSFTLTPIIAAELSGSDSSAGLPTTVSLVGRAVLAYPIGWVLDRFGRRLGLSMGYIIGIIASLIAAYSIMAGSFLGFLVGAALLGGSRASAEQTRYVAAEIYPSRRQSKVIGWIIFAGTIGAIMGPLLVVPAGTLAENMGLLAEAGPFLVAAVVLLAALAVVFIFLRPDPQSIGLQVTAAEQAQNPDSAGIANQTARSLRKIFNKAPALLAVAAMTIGQVVMVLLMVITPLHMNHHDHATGSISLVVMAHTLGMFGLSGLTGTLVERFGRTTMIIAGSILLFAACVVAPISTGVPLLALAMFLVGLGWNFAFVAGSSLLSKQLIPAERGRAQGAGEMSVSLGAGVAGLISGLVFARGDMLAVAIIGIGFSLALLGMSLWWYMARPAEQAFAAGD